MNIGIWNEKEYQNKIEDVIKVWKQMNASIVNNTWPKKSRQIETISKYTHIFSQGPKNQRAAKGLSILIDIERMR